MAPRETLRALGAFALALTVAGCELFSPTGVPSDFEVLEDLLPDDPVPWPVDDGGPDGDADGDADGDGDGDPLLEPEGFDRDEAAGEVTFEGVTPTGPIDLALGYSVTVSFRFHRGGQPFAPADDTVEIGGVGDGTGLEVLAQRGSVVRLRATGVAISTVTATIDGVVGSVEVRAGADHEPTPLSEAPAPFFGRCVGHSGLATRSDGVTVVVGGACRYEQTPPGSVMPPPYASFTAEVWRPDLQAFTDLWFLDGRPTDGATVTALDDGRILVIGGYSWAVAGADLDPAHARQVFTLDPETGEVADLGLLETPRAGHTATRLPDGRVLLVGGVTHADDSLPPASTTWEVFDPSSGASDFGETALPHGRAWHASATLDDGRVVIVGGAPAGSEGARFIDWLDPETGEVGTVDGDLLAEFTDHPALLRDERGTLFLTNSSTNEVVATLDGATGEIDVLEIGRTGRDGILVAPARGGGFALWGGTGTPLVPHRSEVSLWEPPNRHFYFLEDGGPLRAWGLLVTLPDGSLLAFGDELEEHHRTATRLDPWLDTSPVCTPEEHPPDMVYRGDYCIDVYEASRVDATAASAGVDNMGEPRSVPGVMPWTDVGHTQAAEACRRIGRRLCTVHEWMLACTRDQHEWTTPRDDWPQPYGDTYEPETCNGDEAGAGALRPTRSFDGCTTPDGIFDLAGNAAEWVSTLSGSHAWAGGSYLELAACGRVGNAAASTEHQAVDLGFRCCVSAR